MSLFGSNIKSNDPTTYAYNGNWAHIKIINLNALRSYKHIERPWVDFKAFVKSFKDNFIPGWQEVQYPNQSVPIAHQSMPKRSIQLEWTVPSTDAEEAISNLQKCSWLAQSMYPTLKRRSGNNNYTPKSTFMAVKFANLIQANNGGPLPGYISSFSYSPNFTEGIHILSQGHAPPAFKKYFVKSKGKHLFPSLVDIVMEFKPIQTRDSFGLVENEASRAGWNNSSWPYGIKIDTSLKPRSKAISTGQKTESATADDNVSNAAIAKMMKGESA